jgi:hypothetical protein
VLELLKKHGLGQDGTLRSSLPAFNRRALRPWRAARWTRPLYPHRSCSKPSKLDSANSSPL